jgi:DNA-binding transcriptional LysR family regulator
VLREQASGTRRVFEQFVSTCGTDPAELNVVMELGSNQAVKAAVSAGLGVSAMSRLAVAEAVGRGEMRVIPLAEGRIGRTFTMLHHRDKFSTRAVEVFLVFIATAVPAAGSNVQQPDQDTPQDAQQH